MSPSVVLAALIALSAMTATAQAPDASTGSAPNARPHEAHASGCAARLDSLERLYKSGDPAYLLWDMDSSGCDSAQLYQAYYYQGMGFYILSEWKQAHYFFTAAEAIHGPRDEEILYLLWLVNKKLNRYEEMEGVTMDLHSNYPHSMFLMEILDEWKQVKAPTGKWDLGYSIGESYSNNPYLRYIVTNRLRAGTSQKMGRHVLRETGSLSIKSQPGTQSFQGFQADLGGEYDFMGFSLEGDWGIGYDARATKGVLVLPGLPSGGLATDSAWNLQQGRVSLGYEHMTRSGWSAGGKVDYFQLSKNWRVLGLNHFQSLIFDSWMLIGYVDLENHWINNAFPPFTDSTGLVLMKLDGMQTVNISVTPYFSWKKNSYGIGVAYYYSRTLYGGLIGDTLSLHGVTGTASYGYGFSKWLRANLDASFGYEFDQNETPAYKPKKVYALNAGLTVSY